MINFNYSGNPDSLIFDMDGTLWDTVETYALVWNKYFEFYDIKNHLTKSDLVGYIGLERNKFLEVILPQFSYKKRITIYKEVIEIQNQLMDFIGVNLYEGVLEGLELSSKKYKLFIVSNSPEFMIQQFMKY